MTDLDILRTGFVSFIDGLWWGLRENTGPLSMYEGYGNGFKKMGLEFAEKSGGKGALDAAKIAGQLFSAIGLDIEVDEKSIIVKKCPIWNRILERGLEFSFHVEKICWMPMLEGIGEKTKSRPKAETSLRLIHIDKAKAEYKKSKAKKALEKGAITKEDYDKQIVLLEKSIEGPIRYGLYRFE